MTKLANFTEKPKSREDQIADEDEATQYHERIEDIEEDDDYDDDDLFGMNDYVPYAGYEGGEY